MVDEISDQQNQRASTKENGRERGINVFTCSSVTWVETRTTRYHSFQHDGQGLEQGVIGAAVQAVFRTGFPPAPPPGGRPPRTSVLNWARARGVRRIVIRGAVLLARRDDVAGFLHDDGDSLSVKTLQPHLIGNFLDGHQTHRAVDLFLPAEDRFGQTNAVNQELAPFSRLTSSYRMAETPSARCSSAQGIS